MSGNEATVEQRLVAVERALAEILDQLAAQPPSPDNWLARVEGSISDEAAFLEALEYGRAIRSADRPADDEPTP